MNFINSLLKLKTILVGSLCLQTIISKLKSSAKSFIKFILMIGSFFGLIYQVQIIYAQYMSGETLIRLGISGQPDESSVTRVQVLGWIVPV